MPRPELKNRIGSEERKGKQMNCKRAMLSCLIIVFLAACQAYALTKVADVSEGRLFRMEYSNFADPAFPSTDPATQSPLPEGTFDFFVRAVDPNYAGVAYLNAFAELDPPWSTAPYALEWIVQNVPYQVPDCITAPSHSIWINPREFDGTGPTASPGQHDIIPGRSYETWACLSAEELTSPPVPTELLELNLSAMPAGLAFWGLYDTLDGFGQLENDLPIPSTEAAKATGKTASINGGRVTMPDIAQKPMECGPTSAANSLRWLAETHGFGDKLPRKNDDLIKDLMEAMTGSSERPFGGLSDDQLHDGKVKYAQDKGLPLTVKGGLNDPNASGGKAFDFIKSEFDDGEDIEFLIGWPGGAGSHWVTVTGYKINGDRLFLTVNDPDDGKTGGVTWELDRNGNFTKPKGTMLWAVSESYQEPPPSTVQPSTEVESRR